MYENPTDTPVEDIVSGGAGTNTTDFWRKMMSPESVYNPVGTFPTGDRAPADYTVDRRPPIDRPDVAVTKELVGPAPLEEKVAYDPYLLDKEEVVKADKLARQRESGGKADLKERLTKEEYDRLHETDAFGETDQKRKSLKLQTQLLVHGIKDYNTPEGKDFVKGFLIAEKHGVSQSRIAQVAVGEQDEDSKGEPLKELKDDLYDKIKADREEELNSKLEELRTSAAANTGGVSREWQQYVGKVAAQKASAQRTFIASEIETLQANKSGVVKSVGGYTENELRLMQQGYREKAEKEAEREVFGSQAYKDAKTAANKENTASLRANETRLKADTKALINEDWNQVSRHIDLRVDTATDHEGDINEYSTVQGLKVQEAKENTIGKKFGAFITSTDAALGKGIVSGINGLGRLLPTLVEATTNPPTRLRAGAVPSLPDPYSGELTFTPDDYEPNPDYKQNTTAAAIIKFLDADTAARSASADATKYERAPQLKKQEAENADRMAKAEGVIGISGAAIQNALTTPAGLGETVGGLVSSFGLGGVFGRGAAVLTGSTKAATGVGITAMSTGQAQDGALSAQKVTREWYTKPENQESSDAWQHIRKTFPNFTDAQVTEHVAQSAGNAAYLVGGAVTAATIFTGSRFGSLDGVGLSKLLGQQSAQVGGGTIRKVVQPALVEGAQEYTSQAAAPIGAALYDTRGATIGSRVSEVLTDKQTIGAGAVGAALGGVLGAGKAAFGKPSARDVAKGVDTAPDVSLSISTEPEVAAISITAEMLAQANAIKPDLSEASFADQITKQYVTPDTIAVNGEGRAGQIDPAALVQARINNLNQVMPSQLRLKELESLDNAKAARLISDEDYAMERLRISNEQDQSMTAEQYLAQVAEYKAQQDATRLSDATDVRKRNIEISASARAFSEIAIRANDALGTAAAVVTGAEFNAKMNRPVDEPAIAVLGQNESHFPWAQSKITDKDSLIYSNDSFAVGIRAVNEGVNRFIYVNNDKKSKVSEYIPDWAETNPDEAARVALLSDTLKTYRSGYTFPLVSEADNSSLAKTLAEAVSNPESEARLSQEMELVNLEYQKGFTDVVVARTSEALTLFNAAQESEHSNLFNAAIGRAIGIDKADVTAAKLNELSFDSLSRIRTNSNNASAIEMVNTFRTVMLEKRDAFRRAELVASEGNSLGSRPFKDVKLSELEALVDIISVEKMPKAVSVETNNKATAKTLAELRVELAAQQSYSVLLAKPDATLKEVTRVARAVAANDASVGGVVLAVDRLRKAGETQDSVQAAIKEIHTLINEEAVKVEANPVKSSNTSLGPALKTHIDKANLAAFVAANRKAIPFEAKVKVYANIAEAQADPNSGVGGAIGFRGLTSYQDGKSYTIALIADRIADTADASKVLLHELAGHFAPVNLLSPANYAKLRTTIYRYATSKDAPKGLRKSLDKYISDYRDTTKSEDLPSGKDPGQVRIAEEALGWFAEQGGKTLPPEIVHSLQSALKSAPDGLAGGSVADILNLFKGYSIGVIGREQAMIEATIIVGAPERQGISRDVVPLLGNNLMDMLARGTDHLATFKKGLAILNTILGDTTASQAKVRDTEIAMRNLRTKINSLVALRVNPAINDLHRMVKQLQRERPNYDAYTAVDLFLKIKHSDEINNAQAFRKLNFDSLSEKFGVEPGYGNKERSAIIAELAQLDPKSDGFEAQKRDINNRVEEFLGKHTIDWEHTYAAGYDMTKPEAAKRLAEAKERYPEAYALAESQPFQDRMNQLRTFTLRSLQESGMDSGNISHLQNYHYVPMTPKEPGKALPGSDIKDFATVSGRDLFVREGLGKDKKSPTGQLQTMFANAKLAAGEPLRNALLNNFADLIVEANAQDPRLAAGQALLSALPQGQIAQGPDLGAFANIIKLGELGVDMIDTAGRADAMIFRKGNAFYEMVITEPKLREAMMTGFDRNAANPFLTWGRYVTRSMSLTNVKGKAATVINAGFRDITGAFTAAAASFGGAKVSARMAKELRTGAFGPELRGFIFADPDARAAMLSKNYEAGSVMADLKLFVEHGGYVSPGTTQGFDNPVQHADEKGILAYLKKGPQETTFGGSIKATIEDIAESNGRGAGVASKADAAVDAAIKAIDFTENLGRFALFRAVLHEGEIGGTSRFNRLGGASDAPARKFTSADAAEVAFRTKASILDTGHTSPLGNFFNAFVPFFGTKMSDINMLYKRRLWTNNEAPTTQVQGADGRYYSKLQPGFIKELNPAQLIMHTSMVAINAAVLTAFLDDDELRNLNPKDLMENFLLPSPFKDEDGNRNIYKIQKQYGIDVVLSVPSVLALVGSMKSAGSDAWETKDLARDVHNIFMKYVVPVPGDAQMRQGTGTVFSTEYMADWLRGFTGVFAEPTFDMITNRTWTGAAITPGLDARRGKEGVNYPLTRMTTPDMYYHMAKDLPGNFTGDQVKHMGRWVQSFVPGVPWAMEFVDKSMAFDKEAAFKESSSDEIRASAEAGGRTSHPGFKIANAKQTPEGSMYGMYKEHIAIHEYALSLAKQKDIESGNTSGRISDSLDMKKLGPEARAYYNNTPGLMNAQKLWRDYQRESRKGLDLAKEGRATDDIDKRVTGVTQARGVALRYEARMKQALKINQ